MRKVQYIKTPAGDDLAVLPRADLEALIRIAENAEDAAIINGDYGDSAPNYSRHRPSD